VEEKLTARAKLIYERDSNSPLFLRVADTYLQSNNPAYAISILEDGLKNFPDHPLALILMGRANVMLNEIEMAEFFFKKSSELLNTNRTYIYYKRNIIFQINSFRHLILQEEVSSSIHQKRRYQELRI
jgi:hypothetical protein